MTRKKRVSKSSWSTDSHSIFGDKGQIFLNARLNSTLCDPYLKQTGKIDNIEDDCRRAKSQIPDQILNNFNVFFTKKIS